METITESAIDLIKKLLVKTPEERLGSGTNEELSFKQLKAHPYFKGLDIDNIFSLPVPYIPDLHATDQSEQDEKDREETYTTFKGQIEEILKTLSSEGKEVLKHEIVEEKVFVNFNYALLVLYKGGQVCVVGADDLEKKREVQPVKREEGVCKLLSESALLIYEEDRMTEFKTSQAEEWVSALNSQN